MRAAGLLVVLGVAIGCGFDRGAALDPGVTDVDAANTADDDAGSVGPDAAAVVEPIELVTSVNASVNDALQDPNGAVLVFYSWVSLYSENHWGALRFPLTGVNRGAKIITAYLELVVDSDTEDDPNMVITTEASPAPAPLAAVNQNISLRMAGKSRVTWQATGIGAGRQRSPLLTDLVQERIDAAGWPAGGSILFLLDAGTTSHFEYRQFDSGTGADAARLTVKYVNP